jgi:hypothetical protein
MITYFMNYLKRFSSVVGRHLIPIHEYPSFFVGGIVNLLLKGRTRHKNSLASPPLDLHMFRFTIKH